MFIPLYESGANNAKCNRGTENGENSSRLNGALKATDEGRGYTYNHQAQGSDSRLPRPEIAPTQRTVPQMTAATTRRLGRLQQQLAPLPAATKEQSGPQRRVIAAQAGDTLACIGPDGEVEWSQPIGQCHDLFLLPNGNILTQDGWSHVVEYSPDRSEIVCTSLRLRLTPSCSLRAIPLHLPACFGLCLAE